MDSKPKLLTTPLPLQNVRLPNLKLLEKIAGERVPVFLVYMPEEKKHYIMKMFPYRNKEMDPAYANEIRFSFLHHKHVVRFMRTQDKQVSMHKGKSFYSSYILFERAPYGDFATLFETTRMFQDEKLLRTYFHQLVEGIEFLHANGVYHLDIKPDNLLLGEDFNLKITDFDRAFKKGDSSLVGRGTRNYRPPELIECKLEKPTAADVYSAAITLFVLKYGYFPYLEDNLVEGIDLFDLLKNEDPNFWRAHQTLNPKNSHFDVCFKELFFSMVRSDPNKRATFADVKKSNWYKGPVYTTKELQEKVKSYLVQK